jgi:hypothetical protein
MDEDHIMVVLEKMFEKECIRVYKCPIIYDRNKLKEYAQLLLKSDEDLLVTDVYLVLLYVYCSLVVNEPSEDWLFMRFLWRNARHKRRAVKLYYDVTSGCIIVNEIDVSKMIRREMFGFPRCDKAMVDGK